MLLLLTSCGSVRIFEDKVPEPIKKNQIHKETEKQGAFYLALNAKDTNKQLANALSRSLGTPKNKQENADKILVII